MTAWDLVMDPLHGCRRALGAGGEGVYFGVPWQNYSGGG